MSFEIVSKTPQALAAWFITTTKRECWRVLRKQQRERAANVEQMLDGSGLGLREARADERRWMDWQLIQEGLAQVGERCRQLLSLLYFEPGEPSYEAISDQMRMPLGSIGPTRARCLQKMRQILLAMGMNDRERPSD